MKKSITRPDGSVEVVEGTAEEIAEYERKVAEKDTSVVKENKGKRKILLEEIRTMIAEEIKKVPTTHFHFSSCGCKQREPLLPIYPEFPGDPPIWITTTSTGEKTEIKVGGYEPYATSGYIQVS